MSFPYIRQRSDVLFVFPRNTLHSNQTQCLAGQFLRPEPLLPRPPPPRRSSALGSRQAASEPAHAAERSGPPRREAAPRFGRPAAPDRELSKPDCRRRSGQSERGSDTHRTVFVEPPPPRDTRAPRGAPADPPFPPRASARPENAACWRHTNRRDSSTCGGGSASLRSGSSALPRRQQEAPRTGAGAGVVDSRLSAAPTGGRVGPRSSRERLRWGSRPGAAERKTTLPSEPCAAPGRRGGGGAAPGAFRHSPAPCCVVCARLGAAEEARRG